LLFVVTPRLVRPQPGNISLPTDKVPDPNRADVMLNGRLEGKATAVQPAAGNATASAPPAAAGGFEMK
jgi:pilus assembly protein CpaC